MKDEMVMEKLGNAFKRGGQFTVLLQGGTRGPAAATLFQGGKPLAQVTGDSGAQELAAGLQAKFDAMAAEDAMLTLVGWWSKGKPVPIPIPFPPPKPLEPAIAMAGQLIGSIGEALHRALPPVEEPRREGWPPR